MRSSAVAVMPKDRGWASSMSPVDLMKRIVMRLSTRFGIEAVRVPRLPDPDLLGSYPELALTTWQHGRADRDVRVRAHDFVDAHLGRAPIVIPAAASTPRRAWMYWDQGWDAVPPIVAACRARLERYADGFEVVLLDSRNLSRYADLPDAVRTNTGSNRTAFSEVLRFELMARHGGVWLDATCWLTKPLGELARFAADEFFAYRMSNGWTPAWLMASPPSHIIPTVMRDLLVAWWSMTTEHPAYFWYIHLFEAAANRIPEFARAWRHSPDAAARLGILLHRVMDRPLDERLLDVIEGATFVQKLSYKHHAAAAPAPGSFAERILSRG